MRKSIAAALLPLFAAGTLTAGTAIFEDGFENGLSNWRGKPEFVVSTEQAATGENSMMISGRGLVETAPIPVRPSTRYEVSWNSFSEQYSSFSFSAVVFDGGQRRLSPPGTNTTSEGLWGAGKQKRRFWLPMTLRFDTGPDARFVRLCVSAGKPSRIWIDDVVLKEVAPPVPAAADADPAAPYTAGSLMLPGPDGILYPNFLRAGLAKPWALPEKVFRVEEFGAVADDGRDDSDAIERAIAAAGASERGGVVLFGRGVYRITRKLSIRHDNVVLRGEDRDATRLELGIPDNGIGIFTAGSDDRISPRATVRVYFPSDGAKKVTVTAGKGRTEAFETFEALPDAPGFAVVVFRMEPHFDALGEGPCRITAEAEYADGRKESTSVPFVLDRSHRPDVYASSYLTFAGRSGAAANHPFSGAKRGDRAVELAEAADIRPGELVELLRPLDSAFNPYCPWWRTLEFRAEVAAVDGRRITLAQPLRIDFPAESEPYLVRRDPVRNSGIENMTLSQLGQIQAELKMRTVSFTDAFSCRATGLTIDRPGTSGVYGVRVKNCEFSDSRFLKPWRTKLGGLAYVGWDRAWDCLIEGIESDSMRHAPLFNWNSSGNVVTNGNFRESDAQFHSGYCHDNLIEASRIVTTTNRFNSYGWALFAVPADDSMHGMIGPRNVFYNCDTSSFRGGVYLGGPNLGWRIVYNRFDVKKGPGILERFGGTDNIFAGNVFILRDKSVPAVYLESLDSSGDRISGNRIYGGNGKIAAGPGAPNAVLKENQTYALTEKTEIPAVKAPAPSLWKWQKQTYGSRK